MQNKIFGYTARKPQDSSARITPKGGTRPLGRKALTLFCLSALVLPSACGGTDLSTPPSETIQLAQAAASSATMPPSSSMTVHSFGKYLAGRQAQIDSDNRAAAAYYLEALKRDPTNVMLARRAYSFLLSEGQINAGMEIANRALEMDPAESFAPLVLAVADVKAGDFQRAADRLEGVTDQGINAVILPLLRAWSFAGLEQWTKALEALSPLAQSPQLAQIYDFHAGMILELAGRPDDALDHYARSMANGGAPTVRAVQIISSFLDRNGHKEDALGLIDSVRAGQENDPMVIALFGGAGTGNPESAAGGDLPPYVTSARDGMTEALFSIATFLSGVNLADTAMIWAHLTNELTPNYPFTIYMQALLLEKQQRYEDEVALLSDVPRDQPTYFMLQIRRASALEHLDRKEEAIDVLRDLAGEYPDQVDPVVGQAGIFHQQEKWEKAADLYQKSIDFYEDGAPETGPLYYALGMCLERAKRWPEAEQALKKALELMPEHPSVLNYLGYSWIDRGMNLNEGKALIERAVEQRPTEGYIIDSLGWAYYLTGDYAKAVTELERAVEFTPADPTINEHLGDAYWRVGRFNEARFQWTRALSLNPEPDLAEQLEEKLEKGLPPAPESPESPETTGQDENG